MDILAFVTLIIVFIVLLCIIIHFLSSYRKAFFLTLLLLFIVLPIFLFCYYSYDVSFRDFINIHFSTVSAHTYTIDTIRGGTLPLPPKTTKKYRSSDTDATYITKTTLEDIVSFYNKFASPGTFVRDLESDKIRFQYQERAVSITIEQDRYQMMHVCIE